jgi:hypothetical protein
MLSVFLDCSFLILFSLCSIVLLIILDFCIVLCFCLFVPRGMSSGCPSCPVLPLFLDCSFLIMPSVFSNASLPQPWCLSLVNLSLHYSMIHLLRHKSLAYLSTPTYQYKSNTKHYSSYYYQVLRQPI